MTRSTASFAVAVLVLATAVPALAAPPPTTEYTRTECVLATGPPAVLERTGNGDRVLHIRDFPYLGLLTDASGNLTGSNSGVVDIEVNDIDVNPVRGTGSIRGTLAIRDAFIGDFDGTFSAPYKGGVWEGRGVATGIGDDAGKHLTLAVRGLDPVGVCGDPPPGLSWADAAAWTVLVREK
jgi:hypothetical protein